MRLSKGRSSSICLARLVEGWPSSDRWYEVRFDILEEFWGLHFLEFADVRSVVAACSALALLLVAKVRAGAVACSYVCNRTAPIDNAFAVLIERFPVLRVLAEIMEADEVKVLYLHLCIYQLVKGTISGDVLVSWRQTLCGSTLRLKLNPLACFHRGRFAIPKHEDAVALG